MEYRKDSEGFHQGDPMNDSSQSCGPGGVAFRKLSLVGEIIQGRNNWDKM